MANCFKMTQIPWLDKIMYKNWIADSIRRAPGLKILQFVAANIQERREEMTSGKIQASEKKDFLTKYVEIQERNKDLPPW